MPDLIRLKAPENHTALTHGGVPITTGDDGTVLVPRELVDTLRSHGFSDWIPEPPGRDLFAELTARFQSRLKMMSVEDLHRELGGQDSDDASAPVGAPPPGFEPAKVRDEDIDGLKREPLFAYLKHKGVQAIPPITNDKLREIAHRAARGEA